MKWRYVGIFQALYAVVAADDETQIRLAFNSDADGVVQMLNRLEEQAAFGRQCQQDDCEVTWIAATVYKEVKNERDRLRAEIAAVRGENDSAADEATRLKDQNDSLLAMLERLERSRLSPIGEHPICPVCRCSKWAGHDPLCELAALLAAAKGGR